MSIRGVRAIVVAPVILAALGGGCVYRSKEVERSTPSPVVMAPTWQLYGDGGATPSYWVWIPSGMTPPAPPMPPQAG